MIYEILFSIVGVLMMLLFTMIDKYRKQLKRANKWRSDYFAIKSTLDRVCQKMDDIKPKKKGLWPDPESWEDRNTGALKKRLK